MRDRMLHLRILDLRLLVEITNSDRLQLTLKGTSIGDLILTLTTSSHRLLIKIKVFVRRSNFDLDLRSRQISAIGIMQGHLLQLLARGLQFFHTTS